MYQQWSWDAGESPGWRELPQPLFSTEAAKKGETEKISVFLYRCLSLCCRLWFGRCFPRRGCAGRSTGCFRAGAERLMSVVLELILIYSTSTAPGETPGAAWGRWRAVALVVENA